MTERLYHWDDFEATIRIYSEADGGRRTPVFNGIRWDFAYAEAQLDDSLFMIWPDFFAVGGELLPTDHRCQSGSSFQPGCSCSLMRCGPKCIAAGSPRECISTATKVGAGSPRGWLPE